jgi:hypothetical protein
MTDEEESSVSPRRVGKKKHYPFGTPSHLHHPYSEFAHLASSTKNFALALATASDILPEIIEDESVKQRRRVLPVKKKKGKKKNKKSDGDSVGGNKVVDKDNDGDNDEEDDDEIDEDDDDILELSSGMQPCTKIPCQQVLRAIADIQYRNEVERLDIDDEIERVSGDLQATQGEVAQSEVRLDKLTDIGNQLEISLNQVLLNVETLEKTKENLQNERTDINTKVRMNMVLLID